MMSTMSPGSSRNMRKIRMLIPSSVGMSSKTRPTAYFATNHYSEGGYRTKSVSRSVGQSVRTKMAPQPITESSGRLTTDRLTTHDSSLLTDSPTQVTHAVRSPGLKSVYET